MSPFCEHIFEHKGSAVYWFKISHINNPKDLNKKLCKKFSSAREKDKKGWWSKLNKNIDEKSEYLYVGKVEKNLSDRFLQHLGFGHKKTSSIKLLKWFLTFEDVTLTFEYIKIPDNYKGHLEDIENVIWRKFNPIIGAEPRIKPIAEVI